jgi:hypothetical protein
MPLSARSSLGACLAALSLAGCAASNPSPVPLVAPAADVAALAGEWTGEYSGTSGRTGSIVLKLTAGRDTALGDIVMVPTASEQVRPQQPSGVNPGTGARDVVTRPAAQPLTIRFVRIAGDSVSGLLDSYTAPECNCVLTTTFTGHVAGDRIDGTFRSAGDPGAAGAQEGRWTVKRRR